MKAFFSDSKQALKVTLLMFILCGLLYPFAVTGMAQVLFNHEANGSLIEMDGKMIGSDKLGQAFTSPEFFWGVFQLSITTFIRKKILYQMLRGRQIIMASVQVPLTMHRLILS